MDVEDARLDSWPLLSRKLVNDILHAMMWQDCLPLLRVCRSSYELRPSCLTPGSASLWDLPQLLALPFQVLRERNNDICACLNAVRRDPRHSFHVHYSLPLEDVLPEGAPEYESLEDWRPGKPRPPLADRDNEDLPVVDSHALPAPGDPAVHPSVTFKRQAQPQAGASEDAVWFDHSDNPIDLGVVWGQAPAISLKRSGLAPLCCRSVPVLVWHLNAYFDMPGPGHASAVLGCLDSQGDFVLVSIIFQDASDISRMWPLDACYVERIAFTSQRWVDVEELFVSHSRMSCNQERVGDFDFETARTAASAALEAIRFAADLASASHNAAATRSLRAAEDAAKASLAALLASRSQFDASVKAGGASGSTNEDMEANAGTDESDSLSSSSNGVEIPERVRRLDSVDSAARAKKLESNVEEDCAETVQFDAMRTWQLGFHAVALAFAEEADAGLSGGDDPYLNMPSTETTFRTCEPGSWTICREIVDEGVPLSRLGVALADSRSVFRHLCGEGDWSKLCGGVEVL